MNREELLKPRYKVIADYPFNRHFPLNEIFVLEFKEERTHVSNTGEPYALIEPKQGLPLAWMESEFNQYPHIFKKLEWWEERKVEDMPQYVKFIDGGEVINLKDADIHYKYGFLLKNEIHSFEYVDFLPATEQEYIDYQNSTNLHSLQR